ncbi:MAG: signal peptidase I, partial [Lachnospiraceae bacterium]|nr:signal peptidase I [Lachnospiraceae bacterium]
NSPGIKLIFSVAFNWLLLIFVAIIAGYSLVTFCVQTVTVIGPSMNGTLTDGQVVFVNKLYYKFHDVERYDIIAFSLVESDDYYDIKRVIGLPGETVSIKEGMVYINNQPLGTSVIEEKILTAGIAKNEIKLGANEYFLLGDNVNNSEDSRYTNIGNVSSAEILGKVSYIWSPKESRGKLK